MTAAKIDESFDASGVTSGGRAVQSCETVLVGRPCSRRATGSVGRAIEINSTNINETSAIIEKCNRALEKKIPGQSENGFDTAGARCPENRLPSILVASIDVSAKFKKCSKNLEAQFGRNGEPGRACCTAALGSVVQR